MPKIGLLWGDLSKPLTYMDKIIFSVRSAPYTRGKIPIQMKEWLSLPSFWSQWPVSPHQ